MMIPLMFIAIVILVMLSAFFSASEMVFSSVSRLRIQSEADKKKPGAALALRIVDRFDDILSSILVGNNLVNVAVSSIGSVIAVTLWGEEWTWVMTVIITVSVIVFGETIPKIVARKNSNRLALILCYPVHALTIIFRPVTVVVVGLVNLIMRALPKPKTDYSADEAQQELSSIIETAEDEEVLDEDQSDLLQAALDFDDTSVSAVMTARVDITAIDIEEDRDEILKIAESSTCSRLPVYEDSLDHVIGILHLNIFYAALTVNRDTDIRTLLSEPVYLYKTTKLPDALNALREAGQRLAIVVDEYGGTMGIVTVEDILEELVGEIWDDNDVVEKEEVIERSDGIYELDGDVPVADFIDLVDFHESDLHTESSTVGGLTTELYGTFPKEGDTVTIHNVNIEVLEMDGLRVNRVLASVTADSDEEDED